MKLLLIEDDKNICSFIKKGFNDFGHKIDICDNGKTGLEKGKSDKYDVIITDRMLPELDGLSIIKNLRENNVSTPILILSALGDIDAKVTGLRAGGDDYLAKPFSFDELLARVESLNRRNNNFTKERQTNLTLDDLSVDLISRNVIRAGKAIDLQAREFKLLEYLLKNKGQIVTRTMLLENVWEYNFDPQTNIIDVHMSRLRNKIDAGFAKPLIKTIRGVGFKIDDEIVA
ncbi:MAG: response regulator transcription factor [Rickettsiales bacterium]|nr:response regulator transcription factor [Rickettsiales bacterium]